MMARLGWLVGLACAVAGLLSISPAIASAAPAAPAWAISSMAAPTDFAPGIQGFDPDQYLITVTNVGGAPSDGTPITITDELPSGLEFNPTGDVEEDGVYAWDEVEQNQGFGPRLPCSEGPPVNCVATEPIHPGESIYMYVGVRAPAGAPASVVNHVAVSGGGAPMISAGETTTISAAPPPVGFHDLKGAILDSDGSPVTQAGSHPYSVTVGFHFDNIHSNGGFAAVQSPRSVTANLPAGLIANPAATAARCTEPQLESETCPAESAVGTLTATIGLFGSPAEAATPLYNMVAPAGVPAEFGANVLGITVFTHLIGGVRTGGDYGLFATANDIPQYGGLIGASATLWGSPADPSHDPMRGACLELSTLHGKGQTCPSVSTGVPFLTMPSACSGPLRFTAAATTWAEPLSSIEDAAEAHGVGGEALGVTGCEKLPFQPTISVQPDTRSAGSPSGLGVALHIPQPQSEAGLAEANLKKTVVSLPAGMVLSASAANGLGACTAEEISLHGKEMPTCPDSSKVGTAEVSTPLLGQPLKGSVYVAQQGANPFGSLLALYLVVEGDGALIKLAGEVHLDPATGQVTATFDENPELPFEELKVNFFGGPRAALVTPGGCGSYASSVDLTPWSTETPTRLASSFAITQGCTAPGFSPSFTAGTTNNRAGAFSTFVLNVSRPDGSAPITGLENTFPEGLLGKLAGVAYCPASGIAQAISREAPEKGRLEQQTPSCPASSEVGSVDVTAGPGADPVPVAGHAYLAGPYKRAPLSLVVVVPAVAGPFDLGTVVDRVALHVNPETAQIHSVADALPHILDGIPLDIRQISVDLDRPGFIVNPTNCEASSVTGSLISASGQVAPLSDHFQVGDCGRLPFKPKLSLRLKGGTRRNDDPALSASLTFPAGPHANVKSAVVSLPHSEFVEQAHIRTICTRVQFAAGGGNGEQCPKGSVYGHAEVRTPLLDQPLSGPVFERSSNHTLPDLALALHGQIDLEEDGVISTDSRHGIRTSFSNVPDAAFSSFKLEMEGGKRGLIVNSEDLCSRPQRASVKIVAQNGREVITHPLIANDCGKGKKHKAKHHKSASKRRGSSHR
jgi:hypothetical protein